MELSDLIEALGDRSRAVPASKFDAKTPGAGSPGIYAWWADEEARRVIGQALGAEPKPLIYIGKAETSFRQRIGAHLRAKIGKSTFRKTLTAILMADHALADQYPDPDERAWLEELTDWMREHLAVAIVPVDEPKRLEGAVIRQHDPPLNLDKVRDPGTPGRTKLRELRSRL